MILCEKGEIRERSIDQDMMTSNGLHDRPFDVLIAEDSPTQREALRYTLKKHGYTVSSGNNGKEALERAQEKNRT